VNSNKNFIEEIEPFFRQTNAMDCPRRCAKKNRIAFGQGIVWLVDQALADVGLERRNSENNSQVRV
jgi:hypothetical protein